MIPAVTSSDAVVTIFVDGKVSIVPMAKLTERVYGLGKLDQLAADLEALRRSLPPYWFRLAQEALEAPDGLT